MSRQADISRLRNALEAMRSNPKDENWRGNVRMLSVDTEYSNEAWELLDDYAQAHKHATQLINRLKQRERGK